MSLAEDNEKSGLLIFMMSLKFLLGSPISCRVLQFLLRYSQYSIVAHFVERAHFENLITHYDKWG